MTNTIGRAYADLRQQKAISLADAAGPILPATTLAAFEAGESPLGYGELRSVLGRIGARVADLATADADSGSWLDRWGYALDAYQRGELTTIPEIAGVPSQWHEVVVLVGRLAVVPPRERPALVTRWQKERLARIVMAPAIQGVFLHLIVFYTAHVLPNTIRRRLIQRLRDESRLVANAYLRIGSAAGALWALTEVELYLGNVQKGEELLNDLRRRLLTGDLYDRLAVRVLEVALAYQRQDTVTAEHLRYGVLAVLRLLGSSEETTRFRRHLDVIDRDLGGVDYAQ